jgi:hypothetical protein
VNNSVAMRALQRLHSQYKDKVFALPSLFLGSRNRIVVSTLRCGRSNPGSNPGYGRKQFFFVQKRQTFLLNFQKKTSEYIRF